MVLWPFDHFVRLTLKGVIIQRHLSWSFTTWSNAWFGENLPEFKHIVSAINLATYGWAKLLVPVLRSSTLNDRTSKYCFEFANDMQHNSNIFHTTEYLASLDIDPLFTNILLEETINIFIELLFKEDNLVSGFSEKHTF